MSRNTGKFKVVWDTPSADHVVVECQDCKHRFNRPLNTLATCKNCGNEEPPVSRTVPDALNAGQHSGKFRLVWYDTGDAHETVECGDCQKRFDRELNSVTVCPRCGNEAPPAIPVPEVSGSAVNKTALNPDFVEVNHVLDKPEMVVHPKHYNNLGALCHHCGGDIECIDVVERMSFNIGSAVKYLWRVDEKHDSVEDLRKARFYIDREISRREKENS